MSRPSKCLPIQPMRKMSRVHVLVFWDVLKSGNYHTSALCIIKINITHIYIAHYINVHINSTITRKVTIPSHKYESRPVNLTKLACCDGHSENQDKDCIPVCSNSCIHGDCFKPEICLCHSSPSDNAPGWSGPTCNRCKLETRNTPYAFHKDETMALSILIFHRHSTDSYV